MSMRLMKILDEYAGRVLILLILILRKFFRKRKSNIKSKNILLIKFWGIGSVILTSPSISMIKKKFPDSVIFFLTLDSNRELCNEIRPIDKVVTINLASPLEFIRQFISVFKTFLKIDFDIIIDFEFYTYFSAIIVSLLKTNTSAGFDNLKNYRKLVYTKSVLFDGEIHAKDNFENLAMQALNLSEADKADFPEFKLKNKILYNRSQRIIVNPNASCLAYERRLPVKSFASIINSLIESFECEIILTGLNDEKEYAEKVYSLIVKKVSAINLTGRTNISELILLIQSSICLITNDSGPLHIASALNIPSVSFFGPESPKRYGPLSDKNLCFYKNLKCSPCMSVSNSKTVNCIFHSPHCMEEFDINEVNKKITLFVKNLIYAKDKFLIQNNIVRI